MANKAAMRRVALLEKRILDTVQLEGSQVFIWPIETECHAALEAEILDNIKRSVNVIVFRVADASTEGVEVPLPERLQAALDAQAVPA